jgi:hypothetical protein
LRSFAYANNHEVSGAMTDRQLQLIRSSSSSAHTAADRLLGTDERMRNFFFVIALSPYAGNIRFYSILAITNKGERQVWRELV